MAERNYQRPVKTDAPPKSDTIDGKRIANSVTDYKGFNAQQNFRSRSLPAVTGEQRSPVNTESKYDKSKVGATRRSRPDERRSRCLHAGTHWSSVEGRNDAAVTPKYHSTQRHLHFIAEYRKPHFHQPEV